MDVYLILCQGQGDTQACIVDHETFQWVLKPETMDGLSTSVKAPPALYKLLSDPEVCKKIWGMHDPGDGSPDPDAIEITCGSNNNDKALQCISTIEGYEPRYYELREVIQLITSRGDNVADTFEGYIY